MCVVCSGLCPLDGPADSVNADAMIGSRSTPESMTIVHLVAAANVKGTNVMISRQQLGKYVLDMAFLAAHVVDRIHVIHFTQPHHLGAA